MDVDLDASGKGNSNPPRSNRKSWAEAVEEEIGMPKWKGSVWDNFDIAIVNSVVCYVLGAHPSFNVLKGYIQRLRGKHGINKVVMLKNGVVLVRFYTAVGINEVIQGGIYHFDSKAFIVKAWTPNMKFSRDELYTVPIWIKLPGLDFKYWSQKGLSKIGSLVRKPLMVDQSTEKKTGLNFAVEVGMMQVLNQQATSLVPPNPESVGNVGQKTIPSSRNGRTIFLPEGISGHCPAKVKLEDESHTRRKAFQYCNAWGKHPQFQNVIEKEIYIKFRQSLYLAEVYLQEQSKVTWLRFRDENTRYFHVVIEYRKLKQATTQLKDDQGNWQTDPDTITNIFVSYYKDLLGRKEPHRRKANKYLMQNGNVLTIEHQIKLLTPFSKKDVKTTMFSIDISKSPGPAGYGVGFF
ncbi:hypothetical protein H5410_046713 [Solanum commersonii]|uniref:DUF4283 domain-containing protein n=1 Tax=Solanum commersonii TaxID=4109 RepID=A0A9J5XF67_SOLCO|nr:hypothetical protein H5410_046713 [Solanum commersonii]